MIEDTELEDIHNCEECRGKIVCISIDKFGNTFCGYCGQQVDYRPYYDNLYKEDMLRIINDLKKEESQWQTKKKKRRKDKRKEIQ